jgi:carbamoyl-phosphate synthase large subunit
MKSTGEVMGLGKTFAEAFIKSQIGSFTKLPKNGKAFISVSPEYYHKVIEVAKSLEQLGFHIVTSKDTAKALKDAGVNVEIVKNIAEGRPHIVDMIKNNEISFIVNVVKDKIMINESFEIRRFALENKVTYFTTISGAKAACIGMNFVEELSVTSIQCLHKMLT